MNVKKSVSIALLLGALGAWSPLSADADESNKLTYLTFSQAVMIPDTCCPQALTPSDWPIHLRTGTSCKSRLARRSSPR